MLLSMRCMSRALRERALYDHLPTVSDVRHRPGHSMSCGASLPVTHDSVRHAIRTYRAVTLRMEEI